jgi:putative ABC transport system permease protein
LNAVKAQNQRLIAQGDAMRWLNQLVMQVRMLLFRRTADTQLNEELRFHLEQQIAENRAAGMSEEEARLAALRVFGNPDLVREKTGATWNWNGLDQFLRDLRIGARTLGRTPGFAVVAILITALGIGASVALFTVVRGVLLRPLPFPDSDRLLTLYERSTPTAGGGDFPHNQVAGGVYATWNRENTTFSSLALVRDDSADLSASGGQLPETLNGAHVSWNLFPTLGVNPALGRGFTPTDDISSANGTVVLSSSLWKRRFGADPAILNHTIYIDAKPYTVIGIMPAWFEFPDSSTQLWRPVNHEFPEIIMSAFDNHMFRVVGRLKPGVTGEEAAANLSVISRQIHDSHLEDPFVAGAANSRPLLEHLVGDVKRPLYILLAATFCLLLIACLNVANLLVARAAARHKELAIRTALGGGRMRLLREHLMESFLLEALGGAVGLLLAYGAIDWLLHTRPDMARVGAIHFDGVVAAFTTAVVILCALFSGLVSAFHTDDTRLLGALHQSSRSHSAGGTRARLRKTLLAIEVGLTVVLLMGASLLVKSYQRLRSTNVGCVTDNVLTMRIKLPGKRYKTPGPAPANFFETLLQRVRALPGVEAVGFVTGVPGQGYMGDSGFSIVEHPPLPRGKGALAIYRAADSGYFGAMGIPFLRGRTFGDNQKVDQVNEVVITESFAKEFFPNEEPLGKHLRVNDGNKVRTIVGIVGDTRYSIGEAPEPMQYYPLFAGEQNNGTLVIRSSQDVSQLALPVQQIIQGQDRDLPVSDVLTMNQLLGKSTLDQSFDATLITSLAVFSLLLAAAGLFGVLSYIVAQRSGEIGIRIALGAQREQVLRGMLADGLRPALIGLLLGLAASAATTQFIKSMLYETQPLDPGVFAAVAALLVASAALACMVPAWRASRLDPMRVLRME